MGLLRGPEEATIGYALRLTWYLLLLAVEIILLADFVPQVAFASVNKLPVNSKWTYILVLVALSFMSMVIDIIYGQTGALKTLMAFTVWQYVMSILWLTGFGIFGHIYIGRSSTDKYEGTNTARLTVGTWSLLIMMLLWLSVAIMNSINLVRTRREKKKQVEGRIF